MAVPAVVLLHLNLQIKFAETRARAVAAEVGARRAVLERLLAESPCSSSCRST
jgi:hypothetical protein